MISQATVRKLAMALPEATGQDHFSMVSYRVRGRIFATVPDPGHVRIFPEAAEARRLAAGRPELYSELWWGRRLKGVTVTLGSANQAAVRGLLARSWTCRAPKALVRAQGEVGR